MMTDEDKFWFVVQALGESAKHVPLTALRAIQLIGLQDTKELRDECAKLSAKIEELQSRVEILETAVKSTQTDTDVTSLSDYAKGHKIDCVVRTLNQCDGDTHMAAKRLGISTRTIYGLVPKAKRTYGSHSE